MNVMNELADAIRDRMKQLDSLEDRVKALEAMLTTDTQELDSRKQLTFPPIDTTAIPERPSEIAAKRLGFESFDLTERN